MGMLLQRPKPKQTFERIIGGQLLSDNGHRLAFL